MHICPHTKSHSYDHTIFAIQRDCIDQNLFHSKVNQKYSVMSKVKSMSDYYNHPSSTADIRGQWHRKAKEIWIWMEFMGDWHALIQSHRSSHFGLENHMLLPYLIFAQHHIHLARHIDIGHRKTYTFSPTEWERKRTPPGISMLFIT